MIGRNSIKLLVLLLFSNTFPSYAKRTAKTAATITQTSQTIEVLFSPDDQPTKRLLEEISKAQSKIYVAVYMITDKRIAKKLIEASNRGLDVRIVTDKASIESPFGKVTFLKSNGIPVHVFATAQTISDTLKSPVPINNELELTLSQSLSTYNKVKKNRHRRKPHSRQLAYEKSDRQAYFAYNKAGLMHEKFAIIDNKVWLGSFNWTVSANRANQENIIILDVPEIHNQFFERFLLLCSRSTETYNCHANQCKHMITSPMENKNSLK